MKNKENLVLVEVTIKDGELKEVQVYEGDEGERKFASDGWCKPTKGVIVHTLAVTVTQTKRRNKWIKK